MTNLPQDFIDKYTRLLGQSAPDFFASFNAPVAKGYRINPLKANSKTFDTPNDGRVPYGKWGYFGTVSGHAVDHVTGVVYSQEPSAQFVGEVLHPKPGERVLDLAAAPGGKSTHLAAFMQQQGLLWSNEIFLNRAKILSENIERMGVQNSIVSSQTPAELSAKLPQYFDKILLDAPCSGEGMFHKNEAAIQQWHKDFPQELADLQRDILSEAVKMLKPGGQIVYSTCTFAPEEDEQMIAWLLSTYPEFSLEVINKPVSARIDDGEPAWADKAYTDGTNHQSQTQSQQILKQTARLWPNHLQGKGHFVAKLSKQANPEAQQDNVKRMKSVTLNATQQEILITFLHDTMIDFNLQGRQWQLFGDRLYLAPIDSPDISNLKILRLGLEVGTFKKNRFEPAHALALALPAKDFVQHYEMTTLEWAKYVHGDVIRPSKQLQKGWVLMTANGNGAGWGRYVDGQIKNFFPKGLRFVVQQDKVSDNQ
ncbi:Ribosomal RNA small subunit methyltransferase F [Leuconostoc citreum LBAE E16]|uniref:RsmB/NOP family class I SAM-dependent RNA methyltransferase n=1 Tax=Leuconostoc citreum TaxID=33964 RepID=UPI00024663B6|nr:RsmF rRNA methyltransferase first C-terminal domain-containing protein [Leuconostoc citreum]CCF28130.1 Ribosomal RNA small subunit methyltransferase F [Leuconostoc citreum LBAE E16]